LKSYRPTREILADMDAILAAKSTIRTSPLEHVANILSSGRHYCWVAIYLSVEVESSRQLLGAGRDPHPGQMSSPSTRSKVLVSIKLAGREIGILDVESEHDHAFGREDQVLLENVAHRLARFLTGPGKYLVRRRLNVGN
jgi:putative methionine-R-sulfoxide reductase with GAF domain